MTKRSCLIELRPDKLLLDSSFEGYKLSLDSIPIYRHQIASGINVVQLHDDQYSFSHVKLFSLHNHLYVNPYHPNCVYFVDKSLTVFKASLSPLNQFDINEVYKITYLQQHQPYNVSVVFPSADVALISDGTGCIHIVRVVEKNNAQIWEEKGMIREKFSCVLADARLGKELHIVLQYIAEATEEDVIEPGLFHTVLKWMVLIQSEDNTWVEKSHKELSINGSVDFVALEPECECIYIISDKQPKWMNDSEKLIAATAGKNIYSWMQTNDEITFCLEVPGDTVKEDLEISITDLQMAVKVKGKSIIDSQLFQSVDKDLTTWTITKNMLEIQLTKRREGLMWSTLLRDDFRGEEFLDPYVVRERLSHNLSSENETGTQPSFNSQQLEECDAVACETTSLVRINLERHSITHEVSLSSCKWLFKVSCEASQPPALCFRHDVDACVWQFGKGEGEEWPHRHIGTFSAFGYVLASKTQMKFVACPANLSYVAVCEATPRVYVYRQPSPLATELKNRITGKKVDAIAKQQLVNLESRDQVLGIHATDSFLYVLMESSLCVLAINV